MLDAFVMVIDLKLNAVNPYFDVCIVSFRFHCMLFLYHSPIGIVLHLENNTQNKRCMNRYYFEYIIVVGSTQKRNFRATKRDQNTEIVIQIFKIIKSNTTSSTHRVQPIQKFVKQKIQKRIFGMMKIVRLVRCKTIFGAQKIYNFLEQVCDCYLLIFLTIFL